MFPGAVATFTAWAIMEPSNPIFVVSIFLKAEDQRIPVFYRIISGMVTGYLITTYMIATIVTSAKGLLLFGMLSLLRDVKEG